MAGESFIEMLDEPRNTLGRTEEVVDIVLGEPSRLDELHACFFQPDEWVRLRAASSFKRVWRAQPDLFAPYLQAWIDEVSLIEQPSVRWTFAQMCLDRQAELDDAQRATCIERMQSQLQATDDWIVQNSTMETLTMWAVDDEALASWLRPELDRLAESHRKSVARRADKYRTLLAK